MSSSMQRNGSGGFFSCCDVSTRISLKRKTTICAYNTHVQSERLSISRQYFIVQCRLRDDFFLITFQFSSQFY